MRRFFALLLTSFFLCGSAFAQKAPKPASEIDGPPRGTLYRIDNQGHTAWLFGTVHVGQKTFYPLEARVMQALQSSSMLVLEADIRNQQAVQEGVMRYGLYPPGEDVMRNLSSDTQTQLRTALETAKLPMDNVMRMRPWMIANMLIVKAMADQGFPPEQGIEQHLLSVAQKQNKKIGELESINFQLSLFASLSREQQEGYLLETLKDLRDGSGVQKGVMLIDAWSRADHAKLVQLKKQLLEDESPSSRFIEDILLNKRNPSMTDRIAAFMQTENTLFVAVGALHLIGEQGIPALLKQRGYTVSRIY